MRQLYKIFHTILLFISFIFGGSYSLNAQTTVPFTASGTWVCPAGVTTITFEAYGAGGGGGGGGASNKYGGGGGGGGGYAIHNSVSVTPGVSYTITIGTEGAAGAAGANGTGGSASSGVFGALTITANGGSGGSGYASASNSGGNGGTGVNGTTNRTGGTGGTGTNSGSGGGGGAAGSTGAGSAGAMPTGGAGGGGSAGDGGDGSTSNSNSGNPGVNYGGGGSGGTKSVSGSAGAPGYALITYATPPPPGSTCASAVSLPCATSSLAGTTVGTTNVAHGTPCSLSNYGVWYTFVGDGQSTTISTTSTMDLEMAVMSGSCGSFTNISCNDAATGAETATFTAVSGTTYYIYIAHYSTTGSTTGAFTISRTCCIPPTTSNAGTDITLGNCVTTATLAGNTPTVGTGTWTCQSGCTGLTITDPNSPTTTVTGFTSGTSTFRWRIINGACTPSNDQVDVIAACPPANNTCATATNLPCGTTDLAGTTAGTSNLAHGTSCSMSNYGVWYSFVGDGQMTTITVVPSGGFDPEMSISSSPTSCGTLTSIACKDVSGTETHTFTTVSGVYYYIYIAYYTSGTTTGAFTISRTCCTAPTIANAGADIITSCTTTATLAGNTATVGTGAWTVVSGPGSVTTPSSPTSGVTGLTSGTTTVFRWTISNACSTSNDNVSVTNLCGGPANQICSAATDLPCGTTNLAGTTNGTSSITNNQSCSMSTYGVWYTFIGDGNTTVITVVPSGGYDPEMSISSSPSSCGTLTSIACKDATGNEEHVFATVAGVYYYVYISYYTTGTTTGNFTISRQCLSCPSGLGSGNVNIASLPYSAAGQTTTGAGDDLTSTNLPTCGSTSYSTGEDKVYIFTPASSGNVTVTLNSGSPGASIKLYQGCPFAGICVAYDEDYTDGVKTFCSSLTAGTTYYLVVDSYDLYSDDLASFTLDITVPTAGAVNELPCNATTIFNGTAAAGNNECTNALSEPATKPSCWGSGPINSVWYKFQATSTSMYLQTTLTTISSTQIAVYTGTCGSLSATPAFCNQDAPPSGCSGSTSRNSVLDMTTLTVGAWYWVRVDGEDDAQGSFNIILNDGTAATTDDPILGQDCGSPVPICTNTVTVPNPSYAGTGNVCDFTGTNNCTSGEKNSVWYTFEIGATGNLNFTIYPNDATSSSNGAETDYDWVLWKIGNADGTTNNTCLTLNDQAPAECNYGSPGITGISPGGNAPNPINSYFDGTFEPTLAVTAGERYLLVVQNYETTSSGFDLDFSTSSAGTIDATPSTIYWNGAANTSFTNVANYGACSVAPACGINVVVNGQGFQPTISGTTNYCRDLTVNAGATLTFATSSTLYICGTLTNYGTIICPASSTIVFVDGSNTTQYVIGNMNGSSTVNRFGNLTVTKASGSVILNANISIGGNFLTSNTTSVFNSNQKHVKLAGHFTNNNGNSTYTNTGTAGRLEFNGIGLQNYNQGSSQLDLNFVTMNNTSTTGNGVFLVTDMFIKSATGSLTLTLGTITTGSPNTDRKVHVMNTTPASVTTGNTASFIDGNLRRYVTTSGDYNWPVGNVAKGFQRAQTIFSVTSGMTYIDSRFDLWPTTPYTTVYAECGVIYDEPSEDNGYWSMIPNAGTCTYNCTLYPLNATNTSGMSSWTIIKRPHTTPIASDLWALNGTCVASTATQVSRNTMTDFSFLGVDQGLTVLPVELLSFSGYMEEDHNILTWTTASERDNDFFTIEKSADGINFFDMKHVKGAGNSTTMNAYETADHEPFNGTNYYRLKQTDFNGQESYFQTIQIQNLLGEFKLTHLHPNPVINDLQMNIESPQKGSINYSLIDNSGRIIQSDELKVNKGSNGFTIDLSGISSGIYNLEIKLNNTELRQTYKIVKH